MAFHAFVRRGTPPHREQRIGACARIRQRDQAAVDAVPFVHVTAVRAQRSEYFACEASERGLAGHARRWEQDLGVRFHRSLSLGVFSARGRRGVIRVLHRGSRFGSSNLDNAGSPRWFSGYQWPKCYRGCRGSSVYHTTRGGPLWRLLWRTAGYIERIDELSSGLPGTAGRVRTAYRVRRMWSLKGVPSPDSSPLMSPATRTGCVGLEYARGQGVAVGTGEYLGHGPCDEAALTGHYGVQCVAARASTNPQPTRHAHQRKRAPLTGCFVGAVGHRSFDV